MLREASIWHCSCPCHDGGMCGFAACDCGRPGRRRVVYPDRPPPVASSPFRWYWNDQGRARPYALGGSGAIEDLARFAALIEARALQRENPDMLVDVFACRPRLGA